MEYLTKRLKDLPSNPGCYIFKDRTGTIIYVGKAKNLKKRVKSYFAKRDHDPKTASLVQHIADVEFFVTSNEMEALVLENNLIKKHRPFYNIDLKDSRRYTYIVVTDEDFPRLMVARDRVIKGRYYGPFVSAEMRDEILKMLRTTFGIRTCNRLKKRGCLRQHIRLCTGPCTGAITEQEYLRSIRDAEQYLKGNVSDLVKVLREEMSELSRQLRFEKAAERKRQIDALERLTEKQKFERSRRGDEDIINFVVSDRTAYLIVFNVVQGILATKHEFSFEMREGLLEEFVPQYYSENQVPAVIVLPQPLADPSIRDYLEHVRGGKVKIVVPKRGERRELLELVKRNVEVSFLSSEQEACSLRESLKLDANPRVIECFDISTIQGRYTVGAMVQFRDGEPDKSNYRRFKIRTVVGSDDFAAIGEIVRRRYARLSREGKSFPDLVVIDGGAGQLKAATDAMNDVGVRIPVIGLAKKLEEIYVPGLRFPIRLKEDSKGLKLLMRVRNEAHRFAITYHKLLRSKGMVGKLPKD